MPATPPWTSSGRWDGARLATGDVDNAGRLDLVVADYASYFGARDSGVELVVPASELVRRV